MNRSYLANLFEEILKNKETVNNLYSNSIAVGILYGMVDGKLVLSFLSKTKPLIIDSTKYIKVIQMKESDGVFYTRFILENIELKEVFYIYCEDLIDSIRDLNNESEIFLNLKNRHVQWKKMFSYKAKMSANEMQGLFGELCFLDSYIIDKYGQSSGVKSWVGPQKYSKDFSIENDWYEVKTILSSVNVVTISSITQLDSEYPGNLIVYKIEKMSEEYSGNSHSVIDIIKSILSKLTDNEARNLFLQKISEYNLELDSDNYERYRIVSLKSYLVDDEFPRITAKELSKKTSIANVKYELFLASLAEFEEEI